MGEGWRAGQGRATAMAGMASRLALALALAVAGCGGLTVKSDYNPTVDLAQYRTYAWAPATWGSSVDDFSRSLIGQRVRGEIERDLASRGMRQVRASDSPDFLVSVRVVSRDALETYDWTSPDLWNATDGVEPVEDSRMVLIEAVHPRSQKVIWWGAVGGDMDESAAKGEVELAVRTVLARFPGPRVPGG